MSSVTIHWKRHEQNLKDQKKMAETFHEIYCKLLSSEGKAPPSQKLNQANDVPRKIAEH